MSYGGAVLEIDLTQISEDVGNWPDAAYFATVKNAELKVSNAGNPMIELEFELHDENRGSGVVKDWLTVTSAFGQRKAKQLVAAIHDVGADGMADFVAENPKIRLEPSLFIGRELLVFLGQREGKDGDGRMFPSIVAPFYAPLSEAETLLGS